MALLFRGLTVDLIIEDNKIANIKGKAEMVVYGVKYRDIKDYLPDNTKKLGLGSSLGEALVDTGDAFAFIIFAVLLITAMVYVTLLLPIIYLITSIFTFGETWRMRHKYRLLIPIDKEDMQKVRQLSREIVRRRGAIDGPKILIDETIMSYDKELLRSFIMLDVGKYLLGGAIIILALFATIYYFNHWTITGFLSALASTYYWLIPAILGAIGFILIIMAGINHRIKASNIVI